MTGVNVDQSYITLLMQLGLPTVALIWLARTTREAGIWFGEKVVTPVANKHIEFVESTKATNQSLTESTQRTAHAIEAMHEKHTLVANDIGEIKERTRHLTGDHRDGLPVR